MHNMVVLSIVTYTLHSLRPAIGRPQHAQQSKRDRRLHLLVIHRREEKDEVEGETI